MGPPFVSMLLRSGILRYGSKGAKPADLLTCNVEYIFLVPSKGLGGECSMFAPCVLASLLS